MMCFSHAASDVFLQLLFWKNLVKLWLVHGTMATLLGALFGLQQTTLSSSCGSGFPPCGIDVVEVTQVQQYAAENPLEDVEPQHETQAGPSASQAESQEVQVEASSSSGGQKRLNTNAAVEDESAKRSKTGEEQPVTPDDSMLDAGECFGMFSQNITTGKLTTTADDESGYKYRPLLV